MRSPTTARSVQEVLVSTCLVSLDLRPLVGTPVYIRKDTPMRLTLRPLGDGSAYLVFPKEVIAVMGWPDDALVSIDMTYAGDMVISRVDTSDATGYSLSDRGEASHGG